MTLFTNHLIQCLFLDAIHNFHPQYRDYTQYSAQVRHFSSIIYI